MPRARADIEAALEWLQLKAVRSMAHWHDRLMEAIHSLERFPTRYHVYIQSKKRGKPKLEVREMLFGKRRGTYQIFYRIIDDKVEILHVRRATRGPIQPDDFR